MGVTAIRRTVRHPQLRRLMGVSVAFFAGEYSYFVLIVVVALDAGGAAAVGQAVLLRVLPGALLAPFTASLATQARPQVHMAIGIGGRALVMIAMILGLQNAMPFAVLVALVSVDSVMSGTVRPLHMGLVVRLADTAADAAAAIAVNGLLGNVAMLAGPALAGLALGILGIGWALALPAVSFAAGAAMMLRIRVPRQTADAGYPAPRRAGNAARRRLRAMGVGFGAIVARRPAAAAAGLAVMNGMLIGIWSVASASIVNEHLGLGQRGVTLIMTFYGAGALLGAVAGLSIVTRRGLPRVLSAAMLGWAITFAAIGAITVPAPDLALAVGVGASASVARATAPTLVRRSVAGGSMVPAAASLQSVSGIANAVGALIVGVMIGWLGTTPTLVVLGIGSAAVTVMAWPQLRRAGDLSADDADKLTVIRATPALALLPAEVLEQLARAATRLAVHAGAEVIRQGDPGDRFYMIAAGLVDVTVDGRLVATLGRGGSFGEIALLRDMPRSATVTARQDLDLVVVDRGEFLGALSGDVDGSGRLGLAASTRLATPPVEERLVVVDRDDAFPHGSITALLASQPLLAVIGDVALDELAQGAKVVFAPAGALIIREGDYGDTYYVIIAGGAQVVEHDSVVQILGPGEGFGEQAILRDVPRSATVRTVGDTTLVALDRDLFQRARTAR